MNAFGVVVGGICLAVISLFVFVWAVAAWGVWGAVIVPLVAVLAVVWVVRKSGNLDG